MIHYPRRDSALGNYVIVCHGASRPDWGNVEVPHGSELQFWVNEGQPAKVAAADLILTELKRNPLDVEGIQKLIDRAWPGVGVQWTQTLGTGGKWVTALELGGDDNYDFVGVTNLQNGHCLRWNGAYRTKLKSVLADYPNSNLNIICCR
jgi:hypothetical protein